MAFSCVKRLMVLGVEAGGVLRGGERAADEDAAGARARTGVLGTLRFGVEVAILMVVFAFAFWQFGYLGLGGQVSRLVLKKKLLEKEIDGDGIGEERRGREDGRL